MDPREEEGQAAISRFSEEIAEIYPELQASGIQLEIEAVIRAALDAAQREEE